MSITILKPGMLTSVQDFGRYGYQHLGVPVSGAIDTTSHRLANFLVGNEEDHATLEITMVGPSILFNSNSCIVITGANLSPTINDEAIAINRPIIVSAGDVLNFGARKSGLRSYLAIHGGIKLEKFMDSYSTYMRGGFGGFKGRALAKGDVININMPLHAAGLDQLKQEIAQIQIYLPAILNYKPKFEIRAIAGPNAYLFTQASLDEFYSAQYTIDTQSDRMGSRLKGPELQLNTTEQLLSEPTSFGSIQVPPDGQPIILMADRQTTGGYAKIANVCSVDIPVIAQTMPGEKISINQIDLAQAQQLDTQRREALGRLFQTMGTLRDKLQDYLATSPS